MLPGMDGWQILQTLRTAKQTPVICLTARDSVDDRVRGLDSGANDYLVKPFSFSELLARVRAQLRQHHALNSTLEISGLRMDSVSQSVSRDNISYFGYWPPELAKLYPERLLRVKFGESTLIVIPIRWMSPFAGSAQKLMILFLKS